MNQAVIRCEALTKQFRDFWLRLRVTAVDGLDLVVEPGQVFGLLGPNGSGKSTTIKMLLGLLFPSSGQVEVLGRSPNHVSTKQRIGYLPEEIHLYSFLNARETLDYYGRLFAIGRQERRYRADQLIEMVGLEGADRRPAGEYSKGMQRRLGLAQALVNDPDLLILDEPTSGLDPLGTRQVKDLLIELSGRGKTLLLSSHLLADVEDVCNKVTILYGGRVQAQGRVEDLLTVEDQCTLCCEGVDEELVLEIQALLSKNQAKLISHGSSQKRLENLFVELVEKAAAGGQSTSGASNRRGLAPFLKGQGFLTGEGTGLEDPAEGQSEQDAEQHSESKLKPKQGD